MLELDACVAVAAPVLLADGAEPDVLVPRTAPLGEVVPEPVELVGLVVPVVPVVPVLPDSV